MTDLWNNPSPKAWERALGTYRDVVRAQGVSGLEELDRWYRETLPSIISSRRADPFITLEELIEATRWKMKRGVWRQRNLILVSSNEADSVEAASRQAFAAVPDPRKPIALICVLSGVGPATASAVLSTHSPALYPFFDELVAAQIPDLGPVAFTPPYYARYAQKLRDRAQALNESREDKQQRTWTANDLAQALWAESGGKSAYSSNC